jgi:hypothetical protein
MFTASDGLCNSADAGAASASVPQHAVAAQRIPLRTIYVATSAAKQYLYNYTLIQQGVSSMVGPLRSPCSRALASPTAAKPPYMRFWPLMLPLSSL